MKQNLEDECKTQRFNIMDFSPGDAGKPVTDIKKKLKTKLGATLFGLDDDTEGNNYGDLMAE